MKTIIKISLSLIILTFSTNNVFSQLRVENDGSLYVNSYGGNWCRANWTKVHYQNSCAYHLWNTYYNQDVFYVRGDGYVWTSHGFLTASDSAFKTNIEDLDSSLNKVMSLRGVKYNRKYFVNIPIDTNITSLSGHSENIVEQKLEPTEYGLIAQEVEKIVPEAVVTLYDSTKAINYTSLIPVLIEAIKEQQIQIESLKENLDICCNPNKNFKTKSIKTDIDTTLDTNKDNTCQLFQNNPNPFNSTTTIKYMLDKNVDDAQLLIFNMQGTLIKSYRNLYVGTGEVIINSGELNAGMYIYSLIVDGRIIDTKNMILTY